MRARWLVALTLTACSPDIAPGSYLCGPEQLCPEGQACNGTDNTCVLPGQVEPFACEGSQDPVGDDAPSAGLLVDNLTCVSRRAETKGCLLQNDVADWYQLDVPDNCTSVQIEARLTFPIAYEPLVMQISTEDGAPAPADTPCPSSTFADEGESIRCFKLTVPNGSHHAIGLVHQGSENCRGACSNNRYTLQLQLSTP
jgi:hypothetical protein